MKRRLIKEVLAIALGAVLVFGGCSKSLMEPENVNSTSAMKGTYQEEDVQWLTWNQEVQSEVRNLAKKGSASKVIKWEKGGKVGGGKTFGNSVNIPPNALTEDTRISVQVNCVEKNRPCSAEVEFLPNIDFKLDVTITLSYKFLKFDGDPQNLSIFWFDNDNYDWVKVENAVLNEKKQTITVLVDHFTRYAWAL